MWNNEYTISTELAREFMNKVYGWMSCALAITAGVAYWVLSTPTIFNTIINSRFMIPLAIAQFGLVIFLSLRIQKMSFSSAIISFLSYSALSGITFSVILAGYKIYSIGLVFTITAGTFLTMAIYGYFTKNDLSGMRSFLMMGLFGIIIAMFMNMWLRSPAMDYYISLIAVGIFTLLTAYDVQKLKKIGQSPMIDSTAKQKFAIIGALMLYLDFVNLFIHLLRLLGKRRN